MGEAVIIVLNEREQSKERAAASLERLLLDEGIESSRVPITPQLVSVLTRRKPRVLVLDYLLGDYSTGLDVLIGLEKLAPENRPSCVFFTDEPSTAVAVSALKLGVADYIQLDLPNSVAQVARAVVNELRHSSQSRATDARASLSLPTLDDLIAQEPASHQMIRSARLVAQKEAPIVVLFGPAGVGRTALGEAIHRERKQDGVLTTLEADRFLGDFADIIAPGRNPAVSVLLGPRRSLLIDHAEEAGEELLELVSDRRSELWPQAMGHQSLTIGTSSQEVARRWVSRLSAELITLPSLRERGTDILGLTQRAFRLAEECGVGKLKPPSAEILRYISELDWPGEIRQLLSVVTDAFIMGSAEDVTIQDALIAARARWDDMFSLQSEVELSPQAALLLVDACQGDSRKAAIRAGVLPSQFRRFLDGAQGAA